MLAGRRVRGRCVGCVQLRGCVVNTWGFVPREIGVWGVVDRASCCFIACGVPVLLAGLCARTVVGGVADVVLAGACRPWTSWAGLQ
jgi:hypothetical protein